MAPINFTVTHRFDAAPQVVWEEMIDWPNHGQWIPATRVDLDEGDPQTVGGTFTGYTGYGPLTLVDRMRVTSIEWDEAKAQGSCEVAKLGPVLEGRAGFAIAADGSGSRLEWFEDVTVPYLPKPLAPIVNKLSAFGFSMGMRKLAKVIDQKSLTAPPAN